MIIGGLQKFSLLDYPEKISAIIFTQGCNFRCQFCYNPMLVWPNREVGKLKNIDSQINCDKEKDHALSGSDEPITEDGLFHFLKSRAGKIQGIVITGGEPTLHKDLLLFIKKIKDLGYLIKLDTNGTNPKMLKELIKNKLIDYIAMDIKAPFEKYEKITGTKINFIKIKKSVKIIINSRLPYEFRTTVVPGLLCKEDIKKIGEIIKGAKKWYFQKFKSDVNLVNKKFQGLYAFTNKEMEDMAKIGRRYVEKCNIR